MRALLRLLERFSTEVDRIAGLCLGIVTVLVFVSALGRYLFAWPIPDSFDIARLLIGVAIMWGLASIAFRGGHITVDLLAQLLPPRTVRRIDAAAVLVLLVFSILLAWKLFTRVERAYSSGEATFDLRLPLWPLLGFAWLGVLAAIVAAFGRFLVLVRRDPGAGGQTIEDGREAPS
jgi:C4-dicarboxylate transporter DctQ subunit